MRKVKFSMEQWELEAPFRITGHVFHVIDMLHVTISENGIEGRGEAAGVYYLGETGASILANAESVKQDLELGADRQTLRSLLPAGGARNAIDCALWDLEAKLSGRTIWDLTGIAPEKTQSFFTIGYDTPEKMAAKALALNSSKLKVKLTGEQPLECISAVRKVRPDAEIIVDVNQGWSFAQLVELAPKLKALDVSMIEQPLPRGGDDELEGYSSPVPLCADESCLNTAEFEQAARRYQVINIKLDKTGGLTEALDLARMAQACGKDLMIGNMVGTSLGMAPGYVVAQLCKYIDLDGALYLNSDREYPMTFDQGFMSRPESELWG
ncbi:MAG: dipeptide epimerase [Gammaproteobacteria bacterium]|nr:dipeptide epimerase [Gammaproteobacteria bacterium]MDH5239992.1 dipeptide epimerase [Gammaproteobacteria bacterium]MDH5260658.1 dipeptide epimerase [Gammaproteobacteria bacterium]MDH5582822.1 dipeptide epimerase [Gammaproteobacteria bacterium]